MDQKRDNKEELLREADTLKKFAFVGILLSTVATIVAVVLIPMLYTYLQYVQMQLEDELNFCVSKTRTLVNEWSLHAPLDGRRVARATGTRGEDLYEATPHQLKQAIYAGQFYGNAIKAAQRQARESYDSSPKSSPVSTSGQITPEQVTPAPEQIIPASSSNAICSCGIGSAGQPGPPGIDGRDGSDGQAGKDGENGQNGSRDVPALPEPCFECPPAPAGPPGNKFCHIRGEGV